MFAYSFFLSYNNTRREIISLFKQTKNLDITSFQAIRILFAYIFCINLVVLNLIVCYACDELIFVLHFWTINLDN
jgi:hypothetical protein